MLRGHNFVDDDSNVARKRPRIPIGRNISNTVITVNKIEEFAAGSVLSRGINPFNRLCEKLLDWRILADLSTPVSGSQRSSDAKDPQTVISKLVQVTEVPIVFKNLDEYISKWESLLLLEIKAGITSTIMAQTLSSSSVLLELRDVSALPSGNQTQPHPRLAASPGATLTYDRQSSYVLVSLTGRLHRVARADEATVSLDGRAIVSQMRCNVHHAFR